jgi:hypothetical protein
MSCRGHGSPADILGWGEKMTSGFAKGCLLAFVAVASLPVATKVAAAGSPTLGTIINVLKATTEGYTDLQDSAKPALQFARTISPQPSLISGLQSLFGSFFDDPLDLTPLLYKLVLESAVVKQPGAKAILFNPAHSLFLLVEDYPNQSPVGVATLSDVQALLKKQPLVDPILSPYAQGFETFDQFSQIMSDNRARDALQSVWATGPRSNEHRELIKYLLLKPLQQAQEVKREGAQCRTTIDGYVDEVRNGNRSAIPHLPVLTNIMRPTHFVRRKDDILLVLSEALLARYYVVSQLRVEGSGCAVVSEMPLFAM